MYGARQKCKIDFRMSLERLREDGFDWTKQTNVSKYSFFVSTESCVEKIV